MVAPMETIELGVRGMTCAACVRRVERGIRKVEGVETAEVNLVTERATVTYDPTVTELTGIAAAIEAAGYEAEARPAPREEDDDGRRSLYVALAATVPSLGLGMAHVGPLEAFATSSAGRVVQGALAAVVLVGPGRRFLSLTVSALRHAAADMNTLVALGSGAAFAASVLGPHTYFEAAGAIPTFALLGRVLESRAKKRLSDAVRALVALRPTTARVLRDGEETEVAIAALRVGDRVRVRPGERVPADGVVASGVSAVDEAMLTGERVPVDESEGATVYGGTLNRSGALTIAVTTTGRAIVAVLVIACPCALGLATPAAVAVGTGRGAELGILVKGGAALEIASRVTVVLCGKTGTLTRGAPRVTEIRAAGGFDEATLLRTAACVERASEHPLARAVVDEARGRGLARAPVTGFESMPGRAVRGEVEGQVVRIGTATWLEIDPGFVSEGNTGLFVTIDDRFAGALALADTVSPEARAAVEVLRTMGLEIAMVTGDRTSTAHAMRMSSAARTSSPRRHPKTRRASSRSERPAARWWRCRRRGRRCTGSRRRRPRRRRRPWYGRGTGCCGRGAARGPPGGAAARAATRTRDASYDPAESLLGVRVQHHRGAGRGRPLSSLDRPPLAGLRERGDVALERVRRVELPPPATVPTMNEAELQIEGMTCGHCVAHVEKALRSLDGVAKVEVEIGRARVAHDPTRVTVAAMLAAIDDAGYTASAR